MTELKKTIFGNYKRYPVDKYIKQLQEEYSELTEKREAIAQALVNAEHEAIRIVKKAEMDAERISEENRTEIEYLRQEAQKQMAIEQANWLAEREKERQKVEADIAQLKENRQQIAEEFEQIKRLIEMQWEAIVGQDDKESTSKPLVIFPRSKEEKNNDEPIYKIQDFI